MKHIKIVVIMIITGLIVFSGCSCSDTTNTDATTTPLESESVPQVTEDPVETNYPSMKTLGRGDFGYITSGNDELLKFETSSEVPGFVDVVSFKKVIDDSSITIYIELRGIPSTFIINQSGIMTNVLEYGWRVNFDVNNDDKIDFDISLTHQKFWQRGKAEETVAIDNEAFNTIAIQHQVSSGRDIAVGTLKINGNTMVIRFEKSQAEELQGIKEDTSFHIFVEYSNGSSYVYDLIPEKT